MVAKAVKTKNCDVTIALRAADSFLQHSKQFTDALPKDLNQTANVAVWDMGGFIASATCLALATELYLKSLLMFFAANIEQEHHLSTIFETLPPELMHVIEKEFNDRYPSLPKSQVLALNLKIPPLDPSVKPIPDTPQKLEKDLRSILERSKDAFIFWRYLYERGEDTRQVFSSYEFAALGLLCEIVGRIVREGIRDGEIMVTT